MRPTRPQLRREVAYTKLYAHSLFTRALAAAAARRKAIFLIAGAALFLITLSIALVEFTGRQEHPAMVASAAPTTSAPSTTLDQPTIAAPPAGPAPLPAPQQPAPVTPVEPAHVVAAGETLAVLALRFGVPLEQIAAANGIANVRRIRIGQRLRIPARPSGVEVIAPGRTLVSYARQFGTTVDQLLVLNPQITNRNRILAGGELRVRQS